jgi:ADP-ribose pyrophosphatase YjhB (NUDIX family)
MIESGREVGPTMSDRVYLAVLRDGCVLQAQRVYAPTETSPSFERWALPGGGLLPGESYGEAAMREAREALGCDVVLGELLLVTEFLRTGAASRSIHFTFRAALMPDAEPRVPVGLAPDDGSGRVVAYRWLVLDGWRDCPAWLRAAAAGDATCHYQVRRW